MRRVCEFLLPVIAVAALGFLLSTRASLTYCLLTPVAYLFGQRLLCGVPLRDSASRTYLMYFLMGLFGILIEVMGVVRVLDALRDSDAAPVIRMGPLIAPRLPYILVHTLAPLVCGIALYVVFSGNPRHSLLPDSGLQAAAEPAHTPDPSEFAEAAVAMMQELIVQTDAIRAASVDFSNTVRTSAGQLADVGSHAATAAKRFSELATHTVALVSDLSSARQSIASMQTDATAARNSISELSAVVEDFSELVSRRILDFSAAPDTSREYTHAAS